MRKVNYDLLFKEIKRKGMTFTYIANEIGMTNQNLSLVKSKGKELSGSQLMTICSILHTTAENFIKKEGK